MLASFQFWVPAVSVALAAAESTKNPCSMQDGAEGIPLGS
jgi:hypothetical protein